MTTRLVGGAAALMIFLGAPAFAESAPAAPTGAAVLAQAQTPAADDARPARRSRKKAERQSAKAPTAGQIAARERQKKCAAEWKTAKEGGKVQAGMKWPKFWSQCNKRLKGEKA